MLGKVFLHKPRLGTFPLIMGDNSTNDSFCSKERIILVSKSTSKLVMALNSLQSKSPELYHLRWIQLLAVYVYFCIQVFSVQFLDSPTN